MTYTASVSREDDMWLADVHGIDGAHAYARSLTKLRRELANAIIVAADLDDDAEVDIAFEPADPENALMASAFAVAERRRSLARAHATVLDDTAALARRLVEAGWSVRDAAGALNITPGRISQLVNS